MVFKISIECDNGAFDDGPGEEIARILRDVAKKLESDLPFKTQPVRDINGNVVGGYWMENARD